MSTAMRPERTRLLEAMLEELVEKGYPELEVEAAVQRAYLAGAEWADRPTAQSNPRGMRHRYRLAEPRCRRAAGAAGTPQLPGRAGRGPGPKRRRPNRFGGDRTAGRGRDAGGRRRGGDRLRTDPSRANSRAADARAGHPLQRAGAVPRGHCCGRGDGGGATARADLERRLIASASDRKESVASAGRSQSSAGFIRASLEAGGV